MQSELLYLKEEQRRLKQRQLALQEKALRQLEAATEALRLAEHAVREEEEEELDEDVSNGTVNGASELLTALCTRVGNCFYFPTQLTATCGADSSEAAAPVPTSGFESGQRGSDWCNHNRIGHWRRRLARRRPGQRGGHGTERATDIGQRADYHVAG